MKPKVDIIIVTYRRLSWLRHLLYKLNLLQFRQITPDIVVIVVDNDPQESAREVCQDRALRYKITYYSEKRKGVSHARNAGLLRIRPDANFVVFIDDDEFPSPQWLEELLIIQERTGADIVTGPVIPIFVEKAPDWIVRGKFMERPRHPDGSNINYARTGNVLMKREVCQKVGLFNEELSLRGGEDTEYFERALKHGFRIFWADRAEVYEWVPPERANLFWILQRAYRTGQTLSYLKAKKGTQKLVIGFEGLARIGIGSLMFLLTLPWLAARRTEVPVKWLRICVRGLGLLTAMLGIWYHEYGSGRVRNYV